MSAPRDEATEAAHELARTLAKEPTVVRAVVTYHQESTLALGRLRGRLSQIAGRELTELEVGRVLLLTRTEN